MRHQLHGFFLLLSLCMTIYADNLLFGESAPSCSEGSSNLTYHSTVSEVRLVFFATDEHSHAVEGLRKDDFAVVDDEVVIRDFRSFSQSDLIKFDVIVLIDSSESVLPQFQQEIADVLQLISQSPWSPEDKVSVVSFSGTAAHVVCAVDCRSSFTADQVASLPKGGATPMFDALEIATNS